MKLLVTGGAGFIGSHFVRKWLAHHPSDEVVTLDLLTYAGVQATIQELTEHPRHRFVQGDICDSDAVQQTMQGCQTVVHFAAETHVDRSITNAARFVRTNVEGTQTLLHWARELGIQRFVHISTDEVYGPILEGAYAESAQLNPRSPYAASKAAGDLLVRAYQETYGLPAIIVRPTNAFGPRQFPEKFIPLCITNALEDRPLPLYGDGLYRRDWLYVEDLCRAIERVAEAGELGAIYNVGSLWEMTNLKVAEMVLQLVGKPRSFIEFVTDRPGHDRRYAMDSTKLSQLGWHPRVAFEDGLRETVAWYGEHLDWWRSLKARLRNDSYHWLYQSPDPDAGQAVGAAA